MTTGLFYCESPCRIRGSIMANSIVLGGNCTVEADAAIGDQLIVGCLAPGLKPTPGVWARIAPRPP